MGSGAGSRRARAAWDGLAVGFLVAAVAGALGCAKAPLRERDDVLALIEEARTAGAESQAPDLYRQAREAFTEAQEKIDDEEYEEGTQALHKAAGIAEEAKALAVSSKPPAADGGRPGATAQPAGKQPSQGAPGEPARVSLPGPPAAPTPAPPVPPTPPPTPTPPPATTSVPLIPPIVVPGRDASAASPPVSAGTPPAVPSGEPGGKPPAATVPAPESGAGKTSAGKEEEKGGDGLTMPSGNPAARIHVVKRGETLATIAQKELGDRERWRDIYEANTDILKGPNSVQAGQKLKIPAK